MMVYGMEIGKISEASQPTAMEVLKSTEWQHDLDSRGRHPAKGAGLSTSGDTRAEGIWQSGWFKYLRRQSTVYVQWQNRTDGWRIQNDRYCIQFQLGSTARKASGKSGWFKLPPVTVRVG